LCSTLSKFKLAVQNVVLAGMRRGYRRRELDRTWGKFLMEWWKAEEMRRGELRAWFRKMTSLVNRKVSLEFKGMSSSTDHFEQGKSMCWYGHRCLYKDLHCPHAHPPAPKAIPTSKPPSDPMLECIPKASGKLLGMDPACSTVLLSATRQLRQQL